MMTTCICRTESYPLLSYVYMYLPGFPPPVSLAAWMYIHNYGDTYGPFSSANQPIPPPTHAYTTPGL